MIISHHHPPYFFPLNTLQKFISRRIECHKITTVGVTWNSVFHILRGWREDYGSSDKEARFSPVFACLLDSSSTQTLLNRFPWFLLEGGNMGYGRSLMRIQIKGFSFFTFFNIARWAFFQHCSWFCWIIHGSWWKKKKSEWVQFLSK